MRYEPIGGRSLCNSLVGRMSKSNPECRVQAAQSAPTDMDVSLRTCGRRRHLLLIYLFVLKAAANCPKPRASRNTVLTNKALLMNDFPDGSDATLECANGYVAESGSGVMSCAGGKWTEPDLSCKKKDCGPPRPQPNMSFNTSAGTLFGDIIRVICDKGYQIIGASYRQCYSAGWKGRAKCETVTCEKPAAVTGGRSLWDSQDDPKYGEVVRFACDEGLALAGRASITCGQAGEYDSGPPECRGAVERPVAEPLAIRTCLCSALEELPSCLWRGDKTNLDRVSRLSAR
ncbi:C4b-binding protein alpha chain [Scophthalmus maximus]|uniref:C4b-binding protein alpha chain n=1 Tax=Scophthalmus maximus TaxID=52904 RepID=A0A2U9BER1_SCOMX|nr:C4b-binding protein alpha chain [Scophthalmus maximus]